MDTIMYLRALLQQLKARTCVTRYVYWMALIRECNMCQFYRFIGVGDKLWTTSYVMRSYVTQY
jgi:hypothetical protein